MHRITVINETHPLKKPLQVGYCRSFGERLRGLMFQPGLPEESGALLDQARDSKLDAAIHMFFVGFDLGIVWLNAKRQVVDICLAKSWRPFYMPSSPARYVMEIHPDRLGEFFTGDCITFDGIAHL